ERRTLHSFPTRRSSDLRIHKLFSFHQKWRKGHHPLAKYVPRTVKPPQENLRLRIMPAHFTSLGNGIDDAPGIADCLLQADDHGRSEEHTSELQSRGHLV